MERNRMILDLPTPAENARKRLCYLILEAHREIWQQTQEEWKFLHRVHELLVEYDAGLVRMADEMYKLAVDSVGIKTLTTTIASDILSADHESSLCENPDGAVQPHGAGGQGE